MPRFRTPRPASLAAVAALAYLAAPGHPLGWLSGLPLGPLGLAALGLFGIVLFAAWPLGGGERESVRAWERGKVPAHAPTPSRSHALTLSRSHAPTLAFAVLTGLKLVSWLVAPTYGLEASYVGRPQSSQPSVERSTEFTRLGATRLDRELSFVGDAWPLYFFNDNVRFNFYQPDEPNRNTLPFVARWRGFVDVPAEGEYRLWLTAAGQATLSLDGTRLEIESGGDPRTVERTVQLAAGQRPIDLEYSRTGGKPAVLSVEWNVGGARAPLAAPALLARQTNLPGPLAAPLIWLSHGLDALYLALLAGFSAVLLAPSVRRVGTALPTPAARAHGEGGANAPGAARRRERLVLAAVLALVFGYGLLSTLDLHRRLVILDGGADWLTYETYARDILLNGPLMTLGRPLGRGRTYFFQPFYPYVLAAFHWLGGEDLYGPVVLQIIGIGVAGVLVYHLGKRLFGRLSGAIALAIVVGLLGPVQFDWVARRLLSENIYFWLLPAAALALIALGDRPSKRLAVLSGVLLGLSCVTRGPTLLWVPPALLVAWVRLRGRERERVGAWEREHESSQPLTLSRSHALTLAVALACMAIIALVPIRNYVVARQWSLVANNGMATMELAHPLTPNVDLRGVERNPVYRAVKLDMSIIQMIEFVRQDPAGYLATLVPLGLYALGLPGMLEEGSAVRWELVALVGLYAAYFVASLRPSVPPSLRPSLPPSLLLHAFIALHFAMMMVFLPNNYGYRQVLPMYLFIAVFAGSVLARVAERLGRRLAGTANQRGGDREQGREVDQHVPGTAAAARYEELA